MRDILRRICQLQPYYSPNNTPEMQERGRLIRHDLPDRIRALEARIAPELGEFGKDFYVEGKDGIGRKSELAWVRFCSRRMSPRPTDGFYTVLHFATDGSALHVAVGCSSSRFKNGYSIVLKDEELDQRTSWARSIVMEARGTIDPFDDISSFGARARLPRSFERACAMTKRIDYEDIEDEIFIESLVGSAKLLRLIYEVQRIGRDISPADQATLDLLALTKARSAAARGQGFGLSAPERRAVELRAMKIAADWLIEHGYAIKDTSATKSYDFEARLDPDVLFVEVKGTTSESSEAIFMTSNEINLHRTMKGKTALLLVTSIKLHHESGGVSGIGGCLEVFLGWDIDEWELVPTAFRVGRRPSD